MAMEKLSANRNNRVLAILGQPTSRVFPARRLAATLYNTCKLQHLIDGLYNMCNVEDTLLENVAGGCSRVWNGRLKINIERHKSYGRLIGYRQGKVTVVRPSRVLFMFTSGPLPLI